MTALNAYFLRLPGVERVLLAIYVILAFFIVSNAPFFSFLYSPGFTQYGFDLPFYFFPLLAFLALASIVLVLMGKPAFLRVLIFIAHYLFYVSSPFAVWGWFYLGLCLHFHFLIIYFLRPTMEGREWLTARHFDFMFSILYLSVILYRLGNEGWFGGDALYYSLSSSIHSRWGFLVLDPGSVFLKVLSYAGLIAEITFIGICLYPEKIRRIVYFLVIALHLSLELMLTEEFWNYTIIFLVICRLSMTPSERPSKKILSVWLALAAIQLFASIPGKHLSAGLIPVRRALVANRYFEPILLRGMNMYETLPGEKYLCPVYMTKSDDKFSLVLEDLNDCRNVSFRWWLYPTVTFLRMGNPLPFLEKSCENSTSKQQGIFYYRMGLEAGAKEETGAFSCWDCVKKRPCEEPEINGFLGHLSQNFPSKLP